MRRNKKAQIVCRNICAEYGRDALGSRWDMLLTVVENNRARTLRDFKFQTDKQLLANQADRVMADNVVTDAGIPADRKRKKKRAQENRGVPGSQRTNEADVERLNAKCSGNYKKICF